MCARAFARLRLDEENPKALWDAAARIVREAEPRLVNQAIMELGATVCSFRSPRCLICPVHQPGFRIANNSGLQRPAALWGSLRSSRRRANRALAIAVDRE